MTISSHFNSKFLTLTDGKLSRSFTLPVGCSSRQLLLINTGSLNLFLHLQNPTRGLHHWHVHWWIYLAYVSCDATSLRVRENSLGLTSLQRGPIQRKTCSPESRIMMSSSARSSWQKSEHFSDTENKLRRDEGRGSEEQTKHTKIEKTAENRYLRHAALHGKQP
jgi:hypothetical protein